MSTLSERITLALSQSGTSQVALARAVGISPAAINQWVSGKAKTISSENLHAAAECLRVDAKWLATGSGQMTLSNFAPRHIVDKSGFASAVLTAKHSRHNQDAGQPEASGMADFNDAQVRKMEEPEKYALVTRVRGVRLAAGNGYVPEDFEEVDNSHAFRWDWLREKGLDPRHLRVWSVQGHSMSPTLESGSVVLVDMAQREVRSGKVYAVVVDGELRLKRLVRRADGAVEVRSDNQGPEYPTETYSGESISSIYIMGRVVWASREF